jgi:hypothetical protein
MGSSTWWWCWAGYRSCAALPLGVVHLRIEFALSLALNRSRNDPMPNELERELAKLQTLHDRGDPASLRAARGEPRTRIA